jgi:hypothetical protein
MTLEELSPEPGHERYDVAHVLPGHRQLFTHHRRRIEELASRFGTKRFSPYRSGKADSYKVASQMTWDIDCDRWEDFPAPAVVRRWRAHLNLQGTGRAGASPDGKAPFH